MLSRSAHVLLLASCLSACATASQKMNTDPPREASPAVTNPLLQPWPGPYGGLPPFDKVKLEHFRPALEGAMASVLAELDRIAANSKPATFENTLAAFERALLPFDRVHAVFEVWSGALNTSAFQSLERELSPKLAAFKDRITQHAGLFRRIEAVYSARTKSGLTSEQQRLAWKIHEDFVRAGAKLDAAPKARLTEINQQLAGLFTRFSQNVLAHETDRFLVLEGEADLAGLPASLREAAAAEARARKLPGKWVIRNTRSSIDPFLTYSERRDLREKAWRLFVGRGNGGTHDNAEEITAILALRAERAKLLGHPTHAHWRLANTMARTPAAVIELLESVWKPAKARVRQEVADMQSLANSGRGKSAKSGKPAIRIEPWDYHFYGEKVRKQKYDLDDAQLKPYLQLDKLREAMFWVAKKLYDLRFERAEGVAVFDPDVTVWRVKDGKSGQVVGIYYFDPFARSGKRSGAWMAAYRKQARLDGEVSAIVSNNCNFLKGKPGATALVSWDDATTMFHEFGHALHGLLSDVTYPSLSGTSVFRDYVELPSQLTEHWLSTPEVLRRFARHVETDKPMPAELIERIERSARFNQGFATVEYLASAWIDIKLHLSTSTQIDPAAFQKDTLQALGMPREIAMRHPTPAFMHIFSTDSYSAGYYSYLWADVLTADAFEAFGEAKGPYDQTVARRLLQHVLSVGNTIDPAEGYRRFRGRDATVAALMRKRGFPVPAR